MVFMMMKLDESKRLIVFELIAVISVLNVFELGVSAYRTEAVSYRYDDEAAYFDDNVRRAKRNYLVTKVLDVSFLSMPRTFIVYGFQKVIISSSHKSRIVLKLNYERERRGVIYNVRLSDSRSVRMCHVKELRALHFLSR